MPSFCMILNEYQDSQTVSRQATCTGAIQIVGEKFVFSLIIPYLIIDRCQAGLPFLNIEFSQMIEKKPYCFSVSSISGEKIGHSLKPP